jgi:hypothetical protein
MYQHERKAGQHTIHRRAQEQAAEDQVVRSIDSLQRTVGNRAIERLLRSTSGTQSANQVQRRVSSVVKQHGLHGISRERRRPPSITTRLIRGLREWIDDQGGLSGIAEAGREEAGEIWSESRESGPGGIMVALVRRAVNLVRGEEGEQSPDEENQ